MRAIHIAGFILAMLAMATCAPMFTSAAAATPATAMLDFYPQDRLAVTGTGSAPSTADTALAVGAVQATGDFTVRWTYSSSGGSRLPIAGAYVELRRSTTSSYAVEATTFTDSQGYAYFQNVAAGTLDAVIFTDDHATVKVLDGSDYDPYSWDTGWRSHSTVTSVETNINDSDRAAWNAYAALRTAADWLDSQTGYHRGSVNVNWPDGDWPHSHGNDIDLPDSGEYADAIWETATVIHEYGHCVQYAMLGDHFPEGDGPDPHYIYSESSPGFAFSEGWAQFFASAVTGNPNRSGDHTSLESTIYADGAFGYDGDHGDWDGNIVEGAVANVLWDILDGVNSADHPSFSSTGDFVDRQFPKLWGILYDHQLENIDDVWYYWEDKDASLQAVFYNARMKKDMSVPVNPDAFTSSHQIGVESDDSTVTVTLVGASDLGGEVAGYSVLWDNSPTGLPDAVMDVTGSSVTSPVLSSGKDWYLHVRAVDGSGNWANDSYTVGPFLISQNAVAQGDPLAQLPGWLPLLLLLAVVCVIVIAVAVAAGNARKQKERHAAQMQQMQQMQMMQYHYEFQGAYPPQQPANVHVTTYHAPICPRCGRVDMGSTYCPYCGWRMR